MLIAHGEFGYLRSPSFAKATEDKPGIAAELFVIAWDDDGECVRRFSLDGDGVVVGDSVASDRQEAIMGFGPSRPPRSTDDPMDENRAEDGGWRVEVLHDDGMSEVFAVSPAGQRSVVWRARGMAVAPAIAATDAGAWVAFHHDVREDTGEPDVAKWIALRFVDAGGDVFEPSAEMVERDRDAQGEEQSFEFPALVVGDDGAVDLFGRGSHNYYRQRVNALGFGPREALSDGVWGCRGRRVAVAKLSDGQVMIAKRERKGIEVSVLDGPIGGAPALVLATVSESESATVSAKENWRGPRVLFGDIQQHSAHSDGIGSADECYLRSRYRYGDDFAALTDHESFLGKRIGPGEWAYLQAVTEHHNAPGEFATIVAYEWTGKMFPGPGHKVIYLDGPGHDIVSRDDVPSGQGIVDKVIEMGAFTGPHHIGWTGADADSHDPKAQPIWEICSCHGCYEHADSPLGARGELRNQFAQPMLNQGHRFGFIACSDSHGLLWHHGECRKRDPFRTGLTGVLAEEKTREALLDAIRNRRCYATSGAKILLDFVAGDEGEVPMGSEVKVLGQLPLVARAQGTTEISSLEFVGPDGVIAQADGQGVSAELSATVYAPYVYARVVQEDGEMAWASPIFMDR